jgi:hypothetical protein
MQSEEYYEQITAKNVRNWLRGRADAETGRRIEDDLKRPDSEVREYLDWMAATAEADGLVVDLPRPRLLERHWQELRKARPTLDDDIRAEFEKPDPISPDDNPRQRGR